MQASSYLGQLIPPPPSDYCLSISQAKQIKDKVGKSGGILAHRIEVLVTSSNKLKTCAAKDAVAAWIEALFKESYAEIHVRGFAVSSRIDEQPHSEFQTFTGAQNRLENLKIELLKEGVSAKTSDGTLRFLISLENGIMLEKIANLRNKHLFETEKGEVWVDRCIARGEIWYENFEFSFTALSEGVTTPREEVEKSRLTNWSQTAGSFIHGKYGWDSGNWHEGIAGKGRKAIMEELVKAGLGLPYTIPIPPKQREGNASLQLQYQPTSIQFFSPADIEVLHEIEAERQRNGIPLKDVEQSTLWREYYNGILHPSRRGPQGYEPILGPDNMTPIYSSCPVLTEDLMVGYFDPIRDQDTGEARDVLHIILLWAEKEGWVLPGKRDRAYDQSGGDISVKDANYSLVEKEIGTNRCDIPYHFILGYFDDRKREERMKSSGFLSFVLLNKKPELHSKRIGVPLNGLVQLAKGEITIPSPQGLTGMRGCLARNHDSLIMRVIETAAFYQAMEKVKKAKAAFNLSSRWPQLPDVDLGECPACLDLQVRAHIICSEGHSYCGICLPRIQEANHCPECRGPILATPILNRNLDELVQKLEPKKYDERYTALTGEQPRSWVNDPAFNGTHIQLAS